ncbi:MAG: globin [Sulfurimonadaceae bacterium]|jgi:hemoglobin|nr:globin [Sulfurimonadaceae bacterium]
MQNNEKNCSNNETKNSCQNGRMNAFTQVSQKESKMEPQSKKFRFGGDEVRVVEAMIDIIFPSVQFPSNKIYKALGEEKIRQMVRYQHDLLLKTKVGKLFPANVEAYNMVVDKTADFFVEVLGGDNVFTSVHGEPNLRGRHFHIPVDESDREIWLAMYKKTLKELAFPKEHLEEFWNWIEPLSVRMINRRTNMDSIKRYYWTDVKEELLDT